MLDLIKEVPQKPGCYLYYDNTGTVIYVGKAKNLKKRMSSYFNRSNNTKTQHLVNKIVKFDYYITKNENEALILENNLIKKYTPFYNIVLKDDKKYPYIVLTTEKHPRLIRTRNRSIKGTYFGPYSSSSFVNLVIDYLDKKTTLRKCTTIPKKECIYYHMKLCYAPCINPNVDFTEEIEKNTIFVKSMLNNQMVGLKRILKKEMKNYADNLKFEEAAKLRNILLHIDDLRQNQSVQLDEKINLNIVNYYKDNNFIAIVIMVLENGKLLNIYRGLIPYYDQIEEEIISFLSNYYIDYKKPDYFATENEGLADAIKNLLYIERKKFRSKDYKQLVDIAYDNAKEYYHKNIEKITKEFFVEKNKGYKKLQEITNNSLQRIEMYDISHLGGDAQVGAMVVYKNGKKTPKDYRKYKIKEEKNIKDDYGSLREVLTRRLSRGIKEQKLPDLIIIDGGKGQISSVLEVMKELKVDNDILLMGLSKDNNHKTKGIVNKNLEEIILNRNSDLYKFLFNLQEEVHRFAITFHRELKIKSLFQSDLDNIPGIGNKRKMKLMEYFKYSENIKNATYEELKELKLPENIIHNILEFYKK